MDLVHRLHYLVLTQKSSLMTMEREERMRVRRQSSLPEYSKGSKGRPRLDPSGLDDVSWSILALFISLGINLFYI